MSTIEGLMTRGPICCTPDDHVIDCAKAMEREDVGVIPIVESRDTRKLVGVVTDRDLALRVVADGRNPADLTVEDCMSEDLVTVKETDDLSTALQLMQEHKLRRIMVVDDDFCCIGVLSQADVAQAAAPDQVRRTVAEISRPD